MKAFLKRRWILLSCAVVLALYSIVDVGTYVGNAPYCSILVEQGSFLIIRDQHLLYTPIYPGLHHPMLWGLPSFNRENPNPQEWQLRIPIWLPLSAVLGWIVWRELRWREKRAKSAGD